MNDLPRQKLRELIATYGPSLCDDPRRCEALLRDFCGAHKREIHVLVSALKERVAGDLLGSQNGVPYEVQFARLTKRLRDNLGLSDDAAGWAVESWALALGVTASARKDSKAFGQKSSRERTHAPNKKPKTTPVTTEQSSSADIRSTGGDAKKAGLLSVRVNDGQAISGLSTQHESNRKPSDDKQVSKQSGIELFPLYGVMLGKTTVQELARLGKRTGSIDKNTGAPYHCYVIQGTDFWFNDANIADHIYIARGIHQIPEQWQTLGFRWGLSYDGWFKLLQQLGYSAKVENPPCIVKYGGHDSLSAKISATKQAKIAIKIELDFNYSNGTRTDSEETLYYIRVTAPSEASPVRPIATPPSSGLSASRVVDSKASEEKEPQASVGTGQSGTNKLLEAIGVILFIPVAIFGSIALLFGSALIAFLPFVLLFFALGIDYNHLGETARAIFGLLILGVTFVVASVLYGWLVPVWNGLKGKVHSYFGLQQ